MWKKFWFNNLVVHKNTSKKRETQHMHYTSVSARRCVVFMNLEMGCHPLAFVESGAMACHPLEVGAMGSFTYSNQIDNQIDFGCSENEDESYTGFMDAIEVGFDRSLDNPTAIPTTAPTRQ